MLRESKKSDDVNYSNYILKISSACFLRMQKETARVSCIEMTALALDLRVSAVVNAIYEEPA